jgi:TrbL/VirB6 plasmid conjugal transfer protein
LFYLHTAYYKNTINTRPAQVFRRFYRVLYNAEIYSVYIDFISVKWYDKGDMRDQSLVLPFGSQPMRKFFLSALAIFMAFFALIAFPTTANAQAAGATWQGSSIVYNGQTYTERSGITAPGVPEGSKVYAYTEPDVSGANRPTTKAHLIYFAPGTDPTKASQANFATYNYSAENNTYTGQTGATTIAVAPQGQAGSNASGEGTSCAVPKVGWMVCPASDWLASSTDWLFGVLSEFLAVQPLKTSQDNVLYTAWSLMRNFANVAFVIAFLVLIYSQLSNVGISNYGIKKMLPRLVVAAILVNISYWVCAVAVDASNILGYSLQDILINLRENMSGQVNTDGAASWSSVTTAILGGGTALTAGFLSLAATGSIVGAIAMLLPLLVGVIVIALVAVIIMAARQALIVILIIVAPLAFVAYLLPNTEKYFERWRGLFTTMLVLFPVFAVIFGGSQVAGTAIIQNANSIAMALLGMATQIAPLVVLPFLIKFSGSLLGRIGGVVNDRSKGLVDHTRQASKNIADKRRSRTLARPNVFNPDDKLGKRAFRRMTKPLAYSVQKRDFNRQEREGTIKKNEVVAEGRWTNSAAYSRLHAAHDHAGVLKETGETRAQSHADQLKTAPGQMQRDTASLHAAKLGARFHKENLEAMHEELGAGHAANPDLVNQARDAQDAMRDLAVASMRKNAAERIQKTRLSDALESNAHLQQVSGGIDPKGAQRALAQALTDQKRARLESIDNARSIIEHGNLDSRSTIRLALGHAQGNIAATDDIMEAAAKKIGSEGNIGAINELIEGLDLSPSGNEHIRVAFVDALKTNGARPKYVGFAKMDEITQGVSGGVGVSGLDEMIKSTIDAGKLSADVLVGQDQDALARVADAIRRNRTTYSQASLDAFAEEIDRAFSHDILKTRIGERKGPLEDIRSQI